MDNFKKNPKFKSLKQEKDFWEKHDSADCIDWSQAKHALFPNLKSFTKTISLRLSESLLNDIKSLANKDDVPYQSLMKIMLAQGLKEAHQK